MKTFDIEIEETLCRVVSIDANTRDEALAKAEEMYQDEQIVLDAENCVGTDYRDVTDQLN